MRVRLDCIVSTAPFRRRFQPYCAHAVVGPAAAVSYLTTSAAGQASSPGDHALCQQYKPTLQASLTRRQRVGSCAAVTVAACGSFASAWLGWC